MFCCRFLWPNTLNFLLLLYFHISSTVRFWSSLYLTCRVQACLYLVWVQLRSAQHCPAFTFFLLIHFSNWVSNKPLQYLKTVLFFENSKYVFQSWLELIVFLLLSVLGVLPPFGLHFFTFVFYSIPPVLYLQFSSTLFNLLAHSLDFFLSYTSWYFSTFSFLQKSKTSVLPTP